MDLLPAAQPAEPELSLEQLVVDRQSRLETYQDAAYGDRYREQVNRVAAKDVDPAKRLAREVARSLFKLMAYKDEYEVARLHTDTAFHERVNRRGFDMRIA